MKFSELVLETLNHVRGSAIRAMVILMTTAPGVANAETPAQIAQSIQTSLEETLYPEGGETFYCGTHFSRPSIMFKPHNIYSKAWIRDHLKCGTHRQCLRNDVDYPTIVKDLHNLVLAKSQIDFKLRTVIFGALDEDTTTDECQLRKHLHIVEPNDSIKGDVARTIMYMHNRYDLPIVGSRVDFIRWHQMDPPSESEQLRNNAIENNQGTRNPYIDNPELLN